MLALPKLVVAPPTLNPVKRNIPEIKSLQQIHGKLVQTHQQLPWDQGIP